jgi:uncharacterized protein (TIGR03435 family)
MRLATFVAILALRAAFGQNPASNLTFDVVSLKPSTGAPIGAPNSDGGPGTRYPERFATNATLRGLVFRAFGLVDFQEQIAGPGWIDKDKFAIDAHMPPGTTKEQFQVMLQNLLAERFKLAVHHESIVLPVYQMVVAKGGIKIKESAPAKADVPAPRPAGNDSDGFPALPPGRPGLSANYSVGSSGQQQSRWRAQQETMDVFARMLSAPPNAGRIVVDTTGLTGKYDFTFFFDIAQPGKSTTDVAESPTLSIFDALEQQLGLKLVDAKQSFDKIVIDHAERVPVEN